MKCNLITKKLQYFSEKQLELTQNQAKNRFFW